jgi:hypothetical protein
VQDYTVSIGVAKSSTIMNVDIRHPETSVSQSGGEDTVGVVKMFDANTPLTIDGITVLSGQSGDWVDNLTIPGWYACVNGNQSKGCPKVM